MRFIPNNNSGGYCVVTPETYHLPTADPSLTCTASWLPYHPMYIPVFPQQQHTFRAPTRSISCQVTQIEEKSSEGSVQQQQQQQQKSKPRPRSHSVRACRGKDKAAALAEKENADFKRTMSVKYKSEKAKAMTKDLNLKTSNLNQEKDKGEKVSLFSKIFGRKKKKLAASGATTASTSSGGGNQASEVEYATFSAQFPPPEWLDSHAMPSNIVYNTTQEQSESVKPHHHRRSHRTKRRGHRAYSYYDTGNDISIEYKGRMPKKNSSVAQSRDSGVNCMGLPQNRQLYVNQPILHTTQESVSFPAAAASADQPTLTTTPATATASSLQPHTISTQRGTPYNSMEHRSPEGSSGSHAVIINDISTDIADAGTNDTEQSPGSGESGSGVAGPLPDGCSVPRMEDRSECEGLSQDLTPNFVAMSYCDSSLGDEGAGGGEVILCQAEINQFQIPQLVLDTEPHGYRNNLGAEPDVALSSGGSKDTLDRTADESERSAETVIRSPQSVVDASKYSSRSSESDAPQHKSMTSHKNSPVQESNSGTPTARGEEMTGEDENHAVRALGNELQEMGVVDSGFSSPRNTDDKENQQLQQQQPPAADARPTRHKNGSQPGRGHHHHNHNHNNVNEASEEYTVPEHKSKHERIKAYVKQSNQLLEQRQFTSHGHSNGNANVWGGDKVAPNDLQAFQQQQLSSKKFGLNGEFEVVGVV
nr:hypothetical protein BaRGS_006687 [Batillaria attramentaria]